MILTTASALLGQAEQPTSAAVGVQSVWDFIIKGGPMMIPIALASLVALAIVIERAISLRKRKVIPPEFLPGLQETLGDGRSGPQRALEYCRRGTSSVAHIFAAAMRHLNEPAERIEKRIEEAGQREVLKLRKYLRALSVIASITPLMGLLGTIFGMIRAFQTVALSAEALGRTELLAKGIYEAMITTAAGLLVAIPVLIGYHWIAAKVERLVLEIDRMTVEFIEEHAACRADVILAAASKDAAHVPTRTAVGEPPEEAETPVEAGVVTS